MTTVTQCPSPTITRDLIAQHNLTLEEYHRICKILGRQPTITELGIFSVMWSEHCSYKSSRVHFKQFPTSGKQLLCKAGEENAGAVKLTDELAVVFKVESHNHPSAVEPHAGAATGVGGILRDIFTMGARPIALMDSLRFGSLKEGTRTRFLLNGVVRGIADYGNCMGVPTVGGELVFDESYTDNPVVNAMCVGLVHPKRLARARARGVGNPVLYVGSSTGRDGLGGASFASREITEASEADRPAVQLGDPFAEKCLLEATLEALATGDVVGIQDMGAAGLTCSTCETASRGGLGMEIDVARVPRRETGMTPYELMLSESQERMLLVAKKGRERAIQRIFQKWGLQSVVIGRVTDDGVLRVKDRGRVVAEIPARALTDEAPVYRRPTKRPANLVSRQQLDLHRVSEPRDYHATAQRMITAPTLASKEWVFAQYDHMVQTNTVVYPGADAAVLRLKGTSQLLAATMDGNGTYCALDPYEGAKLTVAEAARNLVCVGATPLAVTNCLNFGNPEDPEIMWQFQQVIAGMASACRVFHTPVTGGNVSFYNEGPRGAIDPTPVIGMIGVIGRSAWSVQRQRSAFRQASGVTRLTLDDERLTIRHSPNAERPTPNEPWLTPGFKDDEDWVLLLGSGQPSLGGSAYLKVVHGLKRGRPTPVDLEVEHRLHRVVLALSRRGLLTAAHDCADGGLFLALAEMVCASPRRLGASLDCARLLTRSRRGDVVLFGEAPSRIVVTCREAHRRRIEQLAQRAAVPCVVLGSIGGSRLQCRPWLDMEVTVLDRLWRNALAMHVEGVVHK